jgi:protein-S-isoprenylcysteine O-methyltransferase Ste14
LTSGRSTQTAWSDSTEGRVAETDSSGVKFPPPALYLAGFLAGLTVELVFPIDRPPAGVTIAVAVIGVALWMALDGAAMLLFLRAHTSIAPANPTTTLVTSGPYRFTRNPMYVGMAFLYVALAVALGVIWALLFLPAVLVAVDRLLIAREEPYLEARFGEPYRAYKRRVRRWL